MVILVHGLIGLYFLFRFLHFGVEKVLSRFLGIPFPVAEVLTWVIVALVAALVYKKWRR